MAKININKTSQADQILKDYIAKKVQELADQVEITAKQYCPVITGTLQDSIQQTKIDDETIFVGSDVPYAIFVELGTRYFSARSFLRNALKDCVKRITSS